MAKTLHVLVLGIFVTAAQGQRLDDSELIFAYLSEIFPDVVEETGGLSTSIALKELSST